MEFPLLKASIFQGSHLWGPPRLSGVPVDYSRQLCLGSQGLHFSWLLQPLERDCVCMWAASNLPASLLSAFGGILDLTLTDTMFLHVFVQTPILGFQNHFAASFRKYLQTWQAKKCLATFCWTLTMTQKVPHCEESHLPAFGPPPCEWNWVRQASVPTDKTAKAFSGRRKVWPCGTRLPRP